jgi:hypothetical protein
LLARSGRHDEAMAAIEVPRARGPASPQVLYQVACCHAMLARAIASGRPDDRLTPDERA